VSADKDKKTSTTISHRNVLVSKGLSKTFKTSGLNLNLTQGLRSKNVEALKGIDFEMPQGVVCGLLGPNGSGKSTLLKLAADLIRPTSGHIMFFENQKFSEVRKRVGFVPEKPEYPNHFSAVEVLRFHAGLLSIKSERIDEVLELVGLMGNHKRPFGGFSKGMKQRLAIAKALLSDPDFLILDEPLSGLDPDGREALIQVIEGYAAREEKTVLLSSHLLEDVQRICNFLLVLKEGRLVFKGSPFSVIESKTYVLNFKEKSGQIKTVLSDVDSLIPSLEENFKNKDLKLLSIQPERQPLSELYFNFINKKKSSGESANSKGA
jgi:ABC-2 type transport system ATP-binding protein